MKQTGLPIRLRPLQTPVTECFSEVPWGTALPKWYTVESHISYFQCSLALIIVFQPGGLYHGKLQVFFTYQTSFGSTSVALWKWWTWRQGAASVCHTGPLCHTLAGQWYRNMEGTACGRVYRRGETSVLGKCSSSAETPSGSASSSVHTSLSCMGPKWYSQCIPHTSRGSWHQAGIGGGQQKTSVKAKKAGSIKLLSHRTS